MGSDLKIFRNQGKKYLNLDINTFLKTKSIFKIDYKNENLTFTPELEKGFETNLFAFIERFKALTNPLEARKSLIKKLNLYLETDKPNNKTIDLEGIELDIWVKSYLNSLTFNLLMLRFIAYQELPKIMLNIIELKDDHWLILKELSIMRRYNF